MRGTVEGDILELELVISVVNLLKEIRESSFLTAILMETSTKSSLISD